MGTARDFEARREAMVAQQIAARGIDDAELLDAMRTVPREAFIGDEWADRAYADCPLPIPAGQTISQPYIVARMIAAAGVKPGDWVLEVGAGSGYAAAVMSRVAAHVCAVEILPELADLARGRLAALGYTNVEVRTGDGSQGWPEAAPFGAILVAAAAPAVPEPLRQQLTVGGHLVLPVGHADSQQLVRVTRTATDRFEEAVLDDVRFVPLVGSHGWSISSAAT